MAHVGLQRHKKENKCDNKMVAVVGRGMLVIVVIRAATFARER